MVFDAAGRQSFGPPLPPTAELLNRVISEPIRVDGKLVGYVRLLPHGETPKGVDGRFLKNQLRSILFFGGLALIAGAIIAWWVARVFAKRLEDIQKATRLIAQGDFSISVPEHGSGELAETAQNINIMAASLQRLEAARRRWIAEVSHELRTPLAALRAELGSIIDNIRPNTPAALASIDEEAQRLSALVDDLHLLAMADIDGLACQFIATDASAIVHSAVSRFQVAAENKGLSLIVKNSPATAPVYWDPARIDQVLGNVLTNSLRYTDPPGEVYVSLEALGDFVRIRIEDSAPCPDEEQLTRLFEPLYRVDAHRSRLSGGSGMGLVICEAIVHGHRGTISTAPSTLGGLQITINLPADPRPA